MSNQLSVVMINVQRWGSQKATASGLVNVGTDVAIAASEIGIGSDKPYALIAASPRGISSDLNGAYQCNLLQIGVHALAEVSNESDIVFIPSLDVRSDGSDEYSAQEIIECLKVIDPSKTIVCNISRDSHFYWKMLHDESIDPELRKVAGDFLWDCKAVVTHHESLYDYRVSKKCVTFGQILFYDKSREMQRDLTGDFTRSITFQRPSRFKGFWNWVEDKDSKLMISNVPLRENEELRHLREVSIIRNGERSLDEGFFDKPFSRKLLIQSRYDMKSGWFNNAVRHSDHYLMCHDYRHIDGAYGVIEYAQFEALYLGLPLRMSKPTVRVAAHERIGEKLIKNDLVFLMTVGQLSLNEQRALCGNEFSATRWVQEMIDYAG